MPVLYAAGRTFEPVTPSVMRHLPQNGFTLRIVLPARMSVMMYDVARAMIRSPVVLVVASGQTTLPCASVTFSIVWRGISTPPLAMAPYAEIISIGCVSRVPMLSETTGAVPVGNVSPKSLDPVELVVDPVDDAGLDRGDVERELERAAQPDRTALGAVGLRRVVGLGPDGAKLVTTSMNIVAAVIVWSSIPIE